MLNKTLAKVHCGNVYYTTRSCVFRIFLLSCFWSRSMSFGKLNYHIHIVVLLDTHGDAKKKFYYYTTKYVYILPHKLFQKEIYF